MIYIPMPTMIIKGEDEVEKTAAANHLHYYYTTMLEDGTLPHAFYDGSASTFEKFVDIAFNNDVIFLLVYSKNRMITPVAHMHLTNFSGYSAMVHFNVLRTHHSEAVKMGQDVIKYIFKLKRFDGTPLVKCLTGLTPKTNRAALGLIKQLGFEKLGFLDGACHLIYHNRYVDGILTKAVNNG